MNLRSLAVKAVKLVIGLASLILGLWGLVVTLVKWPVKKVRSKRKAKASNE